jgi:signal transduction histidine kinase
MNVSGIGLGLMISKQIVEKYDGKISFTSEEDQGSTFMFTFKLNDPIKSFENESELGS